MNTIGGHAFESCLSLSSITIPSSVTSIGSYAFAHCTSLSCVVIAGSPTVASDAFEGNPPNTC